MSTNHDEARDLLFGNPSAPHPKCACCGQRRSDVGEFSDEETGKQLCGPCGKNCPSYSCIHADIPVENDNPIQFDTLGDSKSNVLFTLKRLVMQLESNTFKMSDLEEVKAAIRRAEGK